MSCAKGLVAKPKGAQILCVDPNEQVAVQPTLQASCCPAGGIMDLWYYPKIRIQSKKRNLQDRLDHMQWSEMWHMRSYVYA